MFENQDCIKRFGLPRSQEDHDLHISTIPEEFQKIRRAWLSKVATVIFAIHLLRVAGTDLHSKRISL